MDGDLIRRSFLEFFQGYEHTVMPSSSLVPAGDPTLLFTSAGMVQFKPFFMGEATPPSRRLTTSQKCFRTTDIDEVGDHKHLTFFEMLGNFSIGDYFKKDAVAMAWEMVTQRFGLSPDNLYVTIYLDDEEAYHHWRDEIGVLEERIYRYGVKDNWWGPAGNEGPCGPCSEIHYDSGPEYGCGSLVPPDELTAFQRRDDGAPLPSCHPNCECERFVELWNLVFMQFYQDPAGQRTPLPAPSIDTGMGLERLAVVLQGKRNLYETDLFLPIVDRVCQLTGKTYAQDSETDYAIRVVAEHARGAAFLIADGVVPGNEGRGYVLRRIIRRAIRYGRRLGLEEPFLTEVAGESMARFQHVYPELAENRDFVMRVVGLEEERFGARLTQGESMVASGIIPTKKTAAQVLVSLQIFLRQYIGEQGQFIIMNSADRQLRENVSTIAGFIEKACNDLAIRHYYVGDPDEARGWEVATQAIVGPLLLVARDIKSYTREQLLRELPAIVDRVESLIQDSKFVSASEAFLLWDTYGFPPELTAEIAREYGLEVDMKGFEREMEAQRERARAAQAFQGAMEMLPTYENLGVGRVEFVGYQRVEGQARVTALLLEGPSTGSRRTETIGHATKGQQVEVVLDVTPFYPEGGGQVGDAGVIVGPNGRLRIEDTQSPVAGLVIHRGVVEEGDISLGEVVEAQVDVTRRVNAARNHSGTHLLHASLRQVLGSHVRQAGSLVAPDRLRFDYSHVAPLSRDELLEVQGLTNQKVQENLLVTTREASYSEAVRQGALAFFGDKYGDVVRVVQMGEGNDGAPFSLEVCGGTHVDATGQVGPLFVVSEASVGGGMRRVEAVTGPTAERLFVERSDLLESISAKLQTPMADLEGRLDSFLEDADRLRKRLASLEREALRREAQELVARAVDVNGARVVAATTSASNSEGMREMGDYLKSQLSSAVVVLGAAVEGRPTLVAMVTDDLVSRGLDAGDIVKEAAREIEGGGGGRPTMAQAGGKRADRLEAALATVADIVRRGLS